MLPSFSFIIADYRRFILSAFVRRVEMPRRKTCDLRHAAPRGQRCAHIAEKMRAYARFLRCHLSGGWQRRTARMVSLRDAGAENRSSDAALRHLPPASLLPPRQPPPAVTLFHFFIVLIFALPIFR
jgi:hypothetical protein